jgi:hypothetical protein
MGLRVVGAGGIVWPGSHLSAVTDRIPLLSHSQVGRKFWKDFVGREVIQ